VEIVDLTSIDGRGPAWGMASEDLNATLLVWRDGEGQPAHVNEERDVALVALAGAGTLVVDGREHQLAAGMLAMVPRGASRSLVAGPDGLRCLSIHRRRGGLAIQRARSEDQVSY
jgi:quercetin dioxygenase-like cupin family protein